MSNVRKGNFSDPSGRFQVNHHGPFFYHWNRMIPSSKCKAPFVCPKKEIRFPRSKPPGLGIGWLRPLNPFIFTRFNEGSGTVRLGFFHDKHVPDAPCMSYLLPIFVRCLCWNMVNVLANIKIVKIVPWILWGFEFLKKTSAWNFRKDLWSTEREISTQWKELGLRMCTQGRSIPIDWGCWLSSSHLSLRESL